MFKILQKILFIYKSLTNNIFKVFSGFMCYFSGIIQEWFCSFRFTNPVKEIFIEFDLVCNVENFERILGNFTCIINRKFISRKQN